MTRPSTRMIVTAAVAAVAIVAGGILAAPTVPHLSTTQTGEPALVAQLETALADAPPGARESVAVAAISAEATTYAGLGADENTEFEIGSITKTMTALLLAQAVDRGDVTLDTPLGSLLDLGDSPAAAVTLGELSSHRSGLPSLSSTLPAIAAGLWNNLRAADPYPFDEGDLLEHAREASVTDAGTMVYSNLGVALLGQALASAAGVDYGALLQRDVLDPLGMRDTYLPETLSGLPADAPTGFAATGRPAGPWVLGAYAPAGGLRSTTADLTLYAQALLTSDPALGVPAADVLDPQWAVDAGEAADEHGVGLAWFTDVMNGDAQGPVTWHNGGTGGYASMLALDREAQTAVIVLSNTAVSVDGTALDILAERTAE